MILYHCSLKKKGISRLLSISLSFKKKLMVQRIQAWLLGLELRNDVSSAQPEYRPTTHLKIVCVGTLTAKPSKHQNHVTSFHLYSSHYFVAYLFSLCLYSSNTSSPDIYLMHPLVCDSSKIIVEENSPYSRNCVSDVMISRHYNRKIDIFTHVTVFKITKILLLPTRTRKYVEETDNDWNSIINQKWKVLVTLLLINVNYSLKSYPIS